MLCKSDLHTKLRMNSRSVPGLATDFSFGFGALNEPLAFCMAVHFKILVINDSRCTGLEYWRGILSIFCLHLRLYILPKFYRSRLLSNIVNFFLKNFSYTKYFALSYSIDIVWILCHLLKCRLCRLSRVQLTMNHRCSRSDHHLNLEWPPSSHRC